MREIHLAHFLQLTQISVGCLSDGLSGIGIVYGCPKGPRKIYWQEKSCYLNNGNSWLRRIKIRTTSIGAELNETICMEYKTTREGVSLLTYLGT